MHRYRPASGDRLVCRQLLSLDLILAFLMDLMHSGVVFTDAVRRHQGISALKALQGLGSQMQKD